jgi:glucose-6-phosphate 1-dehydrogenase
MESIAHIDKAKDAVAFVIFGVTGDLSHKKLLPALFSLYEKQILPDKFVIIGFARRFFTDEQYRMELEAIFKKNGIAYSQNSLNTFLSHFFYFQGLFDDPISYKKLIEYLADIDKNFNRCSHKIFHLSVSSSYYEIILENINKTGLNISCVDGAGMTRILVEKPLGSDSQSARKINDLLASIFTEQQIFRIDHYLMKNALVDLLLFRTLHPKLLKVWSKEFIKEITISLKEDNDAHARGAFYDQAGALRDVGQNHVLQMLALIIMPTDTPADVPRDPQPMRKNRFGIINHAICKLQNVKRGQYDGYVREVGVNPQSKTETYFKIEAEIEDENWRGTSIVLESGKALGVGEVAVTVIFTQPVFIEPLTSELKHIDKIVFYIQPNPRIEFCMKNTFETLEYKKMRNYKPSIPDGYEKVYTDSLHNDQRWFVSREEVEAAWKFIDPIENIFSKGLADGSSLPLIVYKKGHYPIE